MSLLNGGVLAVIVGFSCIGRSSRSASVRNCGTFRTVSAASLISSGRWGNSDGMG